jgi:hypothetical protein
MKTRKKICSEIFKRYQKASKKDKARILDEYAQTLQYNRDYLAHLLANLGKAHYTAADGKPIKLVAKQSGKKHPAPSRPPGCAGRKHPVFERRRTQKSKKMGRPEQYTPDFIKTLAAIWKLFDFPCGRLLAPLMQGMLDYLTAHFAPDEEFGRLLAQISPATIDRKLKKVKHSLRQKGIHTTRPGTLLTPRKSVHPCTRSGQNILFLKAKYLSASALTKASGDRDSSSWIPLAIAVCGLPGSSARL